MSELPPLVKARATIDIEVDVKSTWSHTATMNQIVQQSKDYINGLLRNDLAKQGIRLAPGGKGIRITMVTTSEDGL